jgi:hypothetical protein
MIFPSVSIDYSTDTISHQCPDSSLRAREERSHATWVREALARTPDPHVDWEQVFAQR